MRAFGDLCFYFTDNDGRVVDRACSIDEAVGALRRLPKGIADRHRPNVARWLREVFLLPPEAAEAYARS
jgi:hypothetical protein